MENGSVSFKTETKAKKIIIYSRDELKQHEMNKNTTSKNLKLKILYWRCERQERLNLACEDGYNCSLAAQKQVPAQNTTL